MRCWRIYDDEGGDEDAGEGPMVVAPRTWLLSRGWQKVGGLLHPGEIPSV